MPEDLWQWVANRVPGADGGADVSWPRGNSRVWRVASEGGDSVFVKISPSVAAFEREIAGYAHAAAALQPHQAPRLLAVDLDLLAIMSSPLPGRVVRGLPLEAAEEREVHEQAGHLLRGWHDHSQAPSAHDKQTIYAAIIAQADEANACLERTAAYLDSAQCALVQCVVDELPLLVDEVPIVFRHGDHATRNWLWNPAGSVGVIDFETAAVGIAAEEFVWLSGAVWPERPDLKNAHLTGYGRPLSEAEERLLLLLAARLGVSYLSSGLTKNRPDLVARGRYVLERMARQACHPRPGSQPM
ncbi:aminoglycoside phosphotransferase family protein [Yinghuangia aomiensis]